MAKNTWLSNFGKSVKFGAIEAAKDLNPAIKKLHEDNQEFMNNISQTLSDIHRGQTSISEALSKSSPDLAKTLNAINTVGLRTRNDIKHFIKTGNMQGGREPQGAGGGGAAGGGNEEIDVSKDFDLGEDDFDFSDLPSPEEAMAGVKAVESPEVAAVASVGASQIEAANKTTQATLATGKVTAQSIAKTNKALRNQTALMARDIQVNAKMLGQLSATTISTFQTVGTKLSGQLTMINDNLSNLVEFNNDTHVKYTMAAMAYFDQSLEQLKLIAGAAARLAPEDANNNENQTDYERVFGGGGFDLSSYMGTLKSNLQKTELGPLVGFIENPEMLVQALENPVQMVTTQLIKSAVPKVMKGAMDELNKSVESFFPALLAKLAGVGNDPNSNIVLSTLGKVFGVEAPSARPNLGNYNKGAVPFDGITHKTINQVIPTYLSKILATLSGGEERMFNHETGQFESMSDIRARHQMNDRSMRDSALGDFGTRLRESEKNLVFENENELRIFREAIEGFKDAVVNSGQFVNWNNEDQMAELMQRVNVEGMTEAMRSAMQDWIAYNARLMPRHEQMRASTAAYDYALQRQRNMAAGASRGDYSNWYANSNFTDIDSAQDAIGANRRYSGGGGYYPSGGTGSGPYGGGPGGGGSPYGPGPAGPRFVGSFVRDQYERDQRNATLSNKENPNYGKEVGAGKASFDDLMAGGAKFAMDIQKEYLDEIKKKSEATIKNAHPEDLLDDGYFPEEAKARKRARMSTAEKLKDVAYNKPAGILASAINTINETLYRTLFGAGPDEDSLLQIMANNINSVFSKIREFVVDDLYHPLKRFLFGPDFKKTNFYQFFAGLFKRGSDVMRGEQDSDGNWKGGMASDVMNEFGDAGKAIRNVITGKGYKDSKGVEHPENKDSVLGNIRQAFSSVFNTLKKYVMGDNGEKQEDAWKSEFMKEMKDNRATRLKNKIIDTINGNRAAGGRLRKSGTYILSKGERVIDGHLASGTVNQTGAYDLSAGDIVVPNKDISKSRLEEGNFFAAVLQKTYGKVADKLDRVVEAIHGTTAAVEAGGGAGGGANTTTVDKINDLIENINTNSGRNTQKTPFIDVIFNKVANSLSQFAGVLGGSKNFDNKFVQKEYAQAIRKKAPKAIAHGALGGLGLGLATLAGQGGTFGSYGLLSFFLPGGFIGSALLGLGLGILHQNDSFMNFMYGKKGADGKRMGGVIPKKLQTFLAKNKTGLLGGAMMGAIKGFTGFSIPTLIGGLIPGGAGALGMIGTLGTGLMGPVLFGSAVGLAVKSEGMKKFLFGTGNEKDGKKATGVLNGKMAQKVKSFIPNAVVGSGLGWLGGGMAGSIGVLGMLGITPYTGALLGGAMGIAMASDRFKDALFGKYDEKKKKFVSGGLVDSMKEVLSLEIIRPVSVFTQKSLAKMEHFIATDIVYPIAKAVMPYKVLATKIFTGITNKLQDIMTGVGNGITSVFNTILQPIRWLAKKAWDWTWGASKTLLNSVFSVAGTIISLPFKALGITGSMITAYEKATGGEYKEDLKAARQKADDYYKEHEENFKLRMKDLDEDEKQYKYERKQARKSGYALNEEQLQAKTDQYHEELRTIEEENRKAEAEAAMRRKTAEVQREELKTLLREANLKLDGFTSNGKAILSKKAGGEVITDDKGELIPVMEAAGSSAPIVKLPSAPTTTASEGGLAPAGTTTGAPTGKQKAAPIPAGANVVSGADVVKAAEKAGIPMSAGRKRALQKGIATSSGVPGIPAPAPDAGGNVILMPGSSIVSAPTTTSEASSIANTGNAPVKENIPPIRNPRTAYSSSVGKGSGAMHGPASIHHATMGAGANTVQSAGLARQDRMYDLVSQFYAMVEYKFDDMLGYNDMAANQEDGSAVMKGIAQAGGMAIFNQLILPFLYEQLGSNADSARKYVSNKGRRFLYAENGGARQFIREKLRIADVDELADEEDETRQTVARDYQLNVLRYFHSIESYLRETLDDRLASMIDLLGGIRSNTERHEPPDIGNIGGHFAAGGIVRKTGAYILSAGEKVVRGAKDAYNTIRADAEAEGSFFGGMKKSGNRAINQGMQAVASAIASLKGVLKDIADHTGDALKYARVQAGMLMGGASSALGNAKDSIMNMIQGNRIRSASDVARAFRNAKDQGAAKASSFGDTLSDALGTAKEKMGEAKDTAGDILKNADSKVSSIFGGRTAEVILKERQEAQYRQDVLDALRRGETRDIENNDNTSDWWKTLLKFLPAAITTLAAPILAVATGIKAIYDWFTGGHGGYGSGANGSIAGMENANREVGFAVAKAGARAIARAARTRAGRAIAKVGGAVANKAGKAARGFRDSFKYGDAAMQEARFTNVNRMNLKNEATTLGNEIAELESKGPSMSREEAKLLEQKKADRKVIEAAIEKEGRKVDVLVAQSTAGGALEAKSKGLSTMAEAAEEEGKNIKSKILKGLSEFISAADSAVEKVANTSAAKKVVEVFKSLAERVGKIPGAKLAAKAAKLTGKGAMALFGMVPGLGWLVNGAWAGIEGVLGWMDAAELLGVNPEHCTLGMKSATAITNALMSLPYIMWVDVAIQLTDALVGTEIKRWILVNVYKAVAGLFNEDGNDIENKQEINAKEFEEFQKKEIQRLMDEEGLDLKSATEKANETASYREFQKKKESEYHPYLDKIRETDIGATLLGKNDENGNYQGGLFSKMNDWVDNQLAYLFGQNDTEGNYQKGLFARLKDDIFGITDPTTGETKGGLYETVHNALFGSNDEEGNYQNGFFAQVKEDFWNGVNNNIAWLLGVRKEDVDMLAEAKSKWIDNEIEYVSNGIENNWKWITETAGKKIDKAKEDLGYLWDGVSGFAKNNYEWITNSASKKWEKAKEDIDWVIDGASKAWTDFLDNTGAAPLAAAIFGESDYWETDPETGELVYKKGQKSIVGKALDWLEKDFLGHQEGEGILDYLSRAFKDKVDSLLVGLFGTPEHLTSLGKVTKWIGDGLSDAVDGAINWFKGGWAQFMDSIMGSAYNFLDKFGLAEKFSYRPGDYYKAFLANGGKDVNQSFTNTQIAMADSFAGQGAGDYSQFDPRWAMQPYGNSSYANAGCGPTVMASILSRMGKNVNPYELGTAAAGAGYKGVGGTNERFLPDVASAFGVKSNKLDNMQDVIDNVRSGKQVVLGGMSGSGFGPFTPAGHYTRIDKIDGGSALLADPRGFMSKVSLNDLSRGTRTAYAFEGNGLGDKPFPDFNKVVSGGNVFENLKDEFTDWFLSGGPLSTMFYFMKQDYLNMKKFYDENISEPIGEFSATVKEKIETVAKPVIEFAEKAIKTVNEKGIIKGGFSIIKDLISGFFGFDLDNTPVGKLANDMVDGISRGINKVKDVFVTVANKFDEAEKKLNKLVMDSFIGKALEGLISFAKEKAGGPIKGVIDTVEDWFKDVGKKWFGLGGSGLGKGIPKNITPGKGSKQFEQEAFLNYMIGGAGSGMVNFNQNKGDWANASLLPGSPDYGNMNDIGCGPTALASAIANADGMAITPKDTMKLVSGADVAKDGNKGVLPRFFPKAMHAMGGEFYAINPNDERSVKNAIASGASLVAGGRSDTNDGSGLFTTGGHYANIKGGFMKNGEVYVNGNDPLGRGKSMYKLKDVLNDVRSGGPNMIGVISPNGALPGGVNAIPMGSAMFGGSGNTMSIGAQTGKDCTCHAAAALINAYTGSSKKNTDYTFGTWYNAVKGMPAAEYGFNRSNRSGFEEKVKSHFDSRPEDPIYLYQTGGDGNRVPNVHAINRVSGNHATVIGRRLSSGKYEVYDSNGGIIHQLDLNQLFDPSAKGDAGNYTNADEANLLLIPNNPPSQPITTWKAANGTSTGSSATGAALKVDIQGAPLCSGAKRPATEGVVIHHMGADDANGKPIDVDWSAAKVHDMHKAQGWEGIGYHFVIRKNGTIERGRAEDTMGAHALHEAGRPSNLCNTNSIGINLSGTFNGPYKPTEQQIESAKKLIAYLANKYKFPIDRKHVIGHRETTNTNCPGDNLYPMLDNIVAGAKSMAVSGPEAANTTGGKPLGFLEGMRQLFSKVGTDYVGSLLSGKEYTGSDLSFLTGGNASGSSSSSSGSVPSAITTGKNADDIWNYFKKVGFSDAEVAGIMGNFQIESALEPKKLQGGKILPEMDDIHSEKGYGLAQWTYWSRKRDLLNYAKSVGKSTGDMSTQLEYAWKEAQGDGVVEAMHAAPQDDPVAQAKIWMDIFERPGVPHWDRRAQAARDFYKLYAGKGGGGFGNTVTPYMTSGLYGGGGFDLGKAFWGSKLGGIAQRFGFKSPEQKRRERQKEIDRQRALERAKKATKAELKKEATAAEIVKHYGIKDTDFDEYGNLKLIKADAKILNNGTQNEKTKYHNQYLQLQQYVKEAEAAKKAKAKKESTPADIVKKYGIKDTDFDEYGNLKLVKADTKLLNNGTQDEKVKYYNQFLQLQQYAKEAEAAKKAKADAIKKSSKITFNTAHSSDTFKADANHKSVIYKPTSSAVETAIRTSGNTSDMVSELKELNIRKEATQMVHYLQIIAKNQYEMAKWLNPGAAKAGAGSSNGSVTRTAQTNMTKPPTIPPSQGFDRKANVTGKKDYGAIHAKNIEIARGGFFKDS